MSKTRFDAALEAFSKGDFLSARDNFEILAATGSKGALLGLAEIYERGNAEIPRDYAMARHWYERALLEAKSEDAMMKLGHYYYLGLGVPKDYGEAFFYYSKLKDRNEPVALLQLGAMHELGQGTEKDLNVARGYYRRAARLGNIHARKNLGALELKHGNFILGIYLWVWAILQGLPLAFLSPNDKRMRTFASGK